MLYRRDPEYKTKKQECLEFYNSRQGEKITFPSFYQLYRKGWPMTMAEMIVPKWKGTPKKKTYSWKWAEEMKRFDEQPEPKAKREWFRNRLKDWYSKEDAMLVWELWTEAKERKRANAPVVVKKPYVPQRIKVEKKIDPNDFRIEITLSKEEANVFRKEYVRMIEDIEWELTYTEEKTEVVKLNNKLQWLYEELKCFNSFNR